MLRFCLLTLLLLTGLNVMASPRYSDPDGCLSCHAYEGLNYIDTDGVLRSATIDRSHYASSLHGSVPCKDCHRNTVDYPHKVENTEVDCSESCHVEEPSEGVKYSHDVIHDEMDKSVHAGGWYKGLTGGNRLEEIETEQDPSCRRCHSNTLYIAETQLAKFKAEFDHAETECGNCHQGKAWMGQFGGHILRRLVGRRWNNQENNQLCIDCHGDVDKMRNVEQENPETLEKHPPSDRFVHSAASYAKTLHGRLIVDGSEYGASCIDCHAPEGWKHEIRSYLDPLSASHIDNLPESCGQSNCHAYSKKMINSGFTETDMHALSLVGITKFDHPLADEGLRKSAWFWSSWPLLLIGLVFIVGSLIWWVFYRTTKKIIPIMGGDRFERVMIGRKPRAARKKPVAKKTVKPIVAAENKTQQADNGADEKGV
jgi:sulfite reductase (NADPH) flavoprotein alpha-component